jgi:hypothetical protein
LSWAVNGQKGRAKLATNKEVTLDLLLTKGANIHPKVPKLAIS